MATFKKAKKISEGVDFDYTPDMVGCVRGFRMPSSPVVSSTNSECFFAELKRQSDSVTIVDGDCLDSVDIDGNIYGTDLQLTDNAFAQVCKVAKVPETFIRTLSALNEGAALNAINAMIQGPASQCSLDLVVDDRNGMVLDVIGRGLIFPISTSNILDIALSDIPGVSLSNGWIEGSRCRFTLISDRDLAEAAVGDFIGWGVSVQVGMDDMCSVGVADYLERLRCRNGMVATDKERQVTISGNRGSDPETLVDALHKTFVESGGRASSMIDEVQLAARFTLPVEDIKSVIAFVSSFKGVTKTAVKAIVDYAMDEATRYGRDPNNLTLWNIVNGVTFLAHTMRSLKKRVAMEEFGYSTISSFKNLLE